MLRDFRNQQGYAHALFGLGAVQVESLFGYARAELAGQPVEMLVPERFRGLHPSHRSGYAATGSA